MSSLRRCWSRGALVGVLALWSGCGGVADPGPLAGYAGGDEGSGSDVGSGGASAGAADGSAGSNAGGRDAAGRADGGSSSEGMNPELGLDGSGGRIGSGGGIGSGGTASGTGGTELGTAGSESGIGGSAPSGSGGTEPGTGGTEAGSGGTESGSGGTEDGGGGTGGTETDVDGDEPGTGGSGGGDEPGTGGSGGGADDGGAGGQIAQGGSGPGGSDEPPPSVDVEVGSCEPFEPCGGDVEGVWTYAAACVDLDDLGVSQQAIDDVCPGARFTLSGQVRGTLSFEDGVVTRQGESSARGEVFVPAVCALAFGGCDGVEDELADGGLAGVTCLGQGSLLFPSCSCSFELDAPDIEAVPFSTDGVVIHLEDGRDLEYCAVGDSLTYIEIGNASEPGLRELTRR